MDRIKTYDATGVAPNGRLYAGDLNLLQDTVAALASLTQNMQVGSIAIGEAGLLISRYGAGEAQLAGALRVSGILRGLGGLYAGSFTTAARDAIAAGSRPYGLVILNTTNNRLEWNSGTDAAPNWIPVTATGPWNTADIVDGAITSAKINAALKPSGGAAAATEALRALGTAAGTAAAGTHAAQHKTGGADPLTAADIGGVGLAFVIAMS